MRAAQLELKKSNQSRRSESEEIVFTEKKISLGKYRGEQLPT